MPFTQDLPETIQIGQAQAQQTRPCLFKVGDFVRHRFAPSIQGTVMGIEEYIDYYNKHCYYVRIKGEQNMGLAYPESKLELIHRPPPKPKHRLTKIFA